MKRIAWRAGILVAAVALLAPAGSRSSQAARGAPAPKYVPTLTEYTVQRGDTLWAISAQYTGSPYNWPRVWSCNPEITNPHWIYPGDIVRFEPSDIELPSLGEVVAANREAPLELTPPPRRANDEERTVEYVAPERVASRNARDPVNVFLTPAELAESGTLTNAVDDRILLSPSDEVFITFPSGTRPSPGERYMVYRTVKQVQHPITKEPFGFMTEVTGFATVRTFEEDVGRAVLTGAFSEIERGQYVTPLVQLPISNIRPTRARVPLSGVVVEVVPSTMPYAGSRQLAFVDIGAASGVQTGNLLRIFVRGDPMVPSAKLPATAIATCMVVDIKPTASTCVITDARQEVAAGLAVKSVM